MRIKLLYHLMKLSPIIHPHNTAAKTAKIVNLAYYLMFIKLLPNRDVVAAAGEQSRAGGG
jgi:hypothetical protein